MTRIERIVLRHRIGAARRAELGNTIGAKHDHAEDGRPWPPVATRRVSHKTPALPTLSDYDESELTWAR